MLFAAPLSLPEIKTLEDMQKNHWHNAPRIRSHAILLSAQGLKIKNLAEVFDVCIQTSTTIGHLCGDDVLMKVADCLRDYDAIRYGGEEFVELLTNTRAKGAKQTLLEAMIHRANKALYYAKEHGRDQCCLFDSELMGEES